MTKPNAAQRRLLQKLAERANRVWQADIAFFERHPERMHRIRPADPDELAFQVILEGVEPPDIPPGYRFFVVIRLVALRRRLRLFVPAPADSVIDVDEKTAEWAFLISATPQAWKMEAAMRKAAGLQS